MKYVLNYPNGREEIESRILELVDINYQKKYWLEGSYSTALAMFFEWFFDDIDFELTAYTRVDDMFYNIEEAEIALSLTRILFDLRHKKIGRDNYNFQDYLNHPKWPEVVAKAQELYSLMKENDEKYGFDVQLHIYFFGTPLEERQSLKEDLVEKFTPNERKAPSL